jgi:glycosyltransferase involved in cell wall biosynthesis
MKLLFVSNFYPPHHLGGYELLCYEVAKRLSARGHDVHVLTSTFGVRTETAEPGIYRRLLLESDVYYYRPQQVFRYRSIQSHNREAVERTLREVAPDAVIVWGMWNLSKHVTEQLEELKGLPVLYYLASSWPIELSAHEAYWDGSRDDTTLGRSFKRIFGRMVKARLRSEWRPYPLRYDHALACCQSVCDELAAAQVKTGEMAVVYHGIDVELYTRAAQRARNQETDQLRVIFVGSLYPHKGPHTAIEAMDQLRQIDATLPVTLDILGKGHPDYTAQLHALVDRLHLQDVVKFHDPIPREQLPEFLARYNALVLPSIWAEPLALISEEALAAQLVLVGTLNGGTKELLEPDVNGLAFPAEDAKALAQQLVRLAVDPALRRRLAQAGWQTVSDRFTMTQTLDEFERHLNAMMQVH